MIENNQSRAAMGAPSKSNNIRPQSSINTGNTSQVLWQHPYVEVFKYFKVMPQGDWRQNKKQGDVEEIFAKEIGRKALQIAGSISANNYVQLPHPTALIKSLGLTGRFLYIQLKSPAHNPPFSLHFDFGMAERGNNIRLTLSNLFKNGLQCQNGFVIQAPLDLRADRWSVVQVDIVRIMAKSGLFPASYSLDGAHQLKGMTLCANLQIRGVYTSDNDYDFVNMPSDMRYKFPFDNQAQVANKWPEYFDWHTLPNIDDHHGKGGSPHKKAGFEGVDGYRQKGAAREEEREKMSSEISELLSRGNKQKNEVDNSFQNSSTKRSRLGKLQDDFEDDTKFNQKENNLNQFNMIVEEKRDLNKKQNVSLGGLNKQAYSSGQYCGITEFKRTPKLSQDPIIELRHIIGYSPERCLSLKWARFPNDPNVIIFTSGGTLIAMDVETNKQKRFFFGHSAPICCFDVNANGALIASAQEGKNSIIRVWEYTSGRCISMMTMPVNTLKCLAFSYDGKYLASVGKDSHNKELIVVWDITRIGAPGGGKPEIVAKQTADFNVIALRFSPIDSSRMASCGKENIRFWRIKDNGSIRGSAVVLNHHARNTVFTCLDFEYGLRAVDPKENESLKRLFVGSKHGMVFQVNYHTESLEATYQTNDAAIYSISVNEAFCVTGSEDTYLRVWPLDFSEFFMEAKHEGTVGAVEISPDGLKVVCGTLNGSLGILDKSNQRYRTVLRSHTDQILQLDFHLGKRIVLTVSKDKTIRLWDLLTSDQVYEFSSPVDQALCIAAHPSLPLFSCGFESGVMRVFDIERTSVADEFCQFNKPLAKMAYSPSGDLLVTCCVDGSVAIHNPRRQHLPVKMLHLEFPPEFVHVAFSTLLEQEQNNELFAVMGDYGNNINIYDAKSFIVSYQIHASQQLKLFSFANNNRALLVITSDCRVRFYSLARYEGIMLREINSVHRGSITSLSVSGNSGFFLTGGEDSILKIWDYEAQKTIPYYFQAFIGHTYPVRGVMFCPSDNSTIITAGDKDGIYLWNFHGDVRTQFAHQVQKEFDNTDDANGGANEIEEEKTLKKSRSGSVLEKLRTNKKEAKQQYKQQIQKHFKKDTFIIPAFKNAPLADLQSLAASGLNIGDNGDEGSGTQQLAYQYQNYRREKQLTYNHYCNPNSPSFEVELSQSLIAQTEEKVQQKFIEPALVNAYDGFGGVNNNIVWCQHEGWMAYTMHNKVVFENVKTREQTVLCDSTCQLSTLVMSSDKKLLAVAEGKPSQKTGNSLIYLYDTQTKKLIQRYTFHQRGVQALVFSNTGRHLISIGVHGENNLAIWDLQSGLVVKSCLIKNTNAVNQIRVDPYVGTTPEGEEKHIQFCIAGNQGLFNIYRYEVSTQKLESYEVDNVPPEFQKSDFTSLAYTQFMNAQGAYFAILGASDGSMTAFDLNQNTFINDGQKNWCISGEIGHARCNAGFVVIASSSGTVARFSISMNAMFPTDSLMVQILRADGPVVALAMDDLNNEGILGTAFGGVYYLNFNEKIMIRILNKAYSVQRPVTSVKFNELNPQLIISNCCSDGRANGSGLAKVWTAQTLDQVMRFPALHEAAGPAVFVLSGTNGGKFSVIAYAGGVIRIINLECLKIDSTYKIQLQSDDEILTSGVFNPNGINIAIGTSKGNIYIASLREDQQGKAKFMFGRFDFHETNINQAVTSVQFSHFDPIGSFLVAFDNGVVRTWQTSVRNEQLMKVLELQNFDSQYPLFDLSEAGFLQFDIVDVFDMFENPHGLEEINEVEKSQLKNLYMNKKHRQSEARFSPSKSSVDIYFCYISALQYIYVRNYIQGAIVKRVSLLHFPTCFSIIDYNQLFIEGEEDELGGEQVLALVGTKEGKVLAYKISSSGNTKLAETRGGLSYGSIAALDISPQLDKFVAATDSGELFTAELLPNLQ